jgi:predicted ATP-grasp superfamily ATP-dependent carboligase
MTKKEKILIGLLSECEKLKNQDQKDLLKFIHTINESFDGISPFSWSEHHGGKKTKLKLKKLYI